MNKLNQIRTQITPERIASEVGAIKHEQFSPALADYIERYKKIGKRESIFVFEWCYRINSTWTVLDVLEDEKENLRDIKTLLNMFVVQIDDISEIKGSDDLLEELLKLPFNTPIKRDHLSKEDDEYFQLTQEIWEDINKRVKKFPLYSKYKDCFNFDIFQLINSVKYGKLVTDSKYHMNETEYWQYFPNSMQIIINADLDLMCTPTFEIRDLSKFREMILTNQKMARIGNWLTTWQREVRSEDYSSVVVPYALSNGIIDYDDLKDSEIIVKKISASDAHEHFLQEWQKLYDISVEIGKKIRSADYLKIIDRFEYLLTMHLISNNLK